MSKETMIPSWLDVGQLQKVLNKRVPAAKVEAPTEGKVFVKEQMTKQASIPSYIPLTLLDKAFVNRGAEALAKHCRKAGMSVTHIRCQNMVRLNKEAGSSLPSPYMSQVDYIIDYTDPNMQRVTATAAIGFDLKGSIHLPASFYSRGKEVAFDRKAVQAFSEGRVYAPANIAPQVPNFHYYRPGPERELIHVGKFGPGSLRGRLEKKAYPVPMCKWCGEVITQIPNGTGWTGPNGQLDCAAAPGAEGSLHEPRNVDETVSNLAQQAARDEKTGQPTIDIKEFSDDVTNPKGTSISQQTMSDPDYGNVEKGRERAGEPNYFNSPDNKLQQKEVKNPKRKASLTGAYNFEKIVLRPGALKDFELVGYSGNSGITILKFDNYNEASRAAHSIADIVGIQVEDTAQFKGASKITAALDDIFASVVPGPDQVGAVRVTLDDDDITFFETDRKIRMLVAAGKINMIDNELWYWEDDRVTSKILQGYVNFGTEASKKTAMVDPFDEIGVPPALDFRYEDGERIFTNDTAEYKGLNLLDEDTWQAYTDILAAAGVTIEYDNVADSFYVWGPQAERTVGNMQDMQDAEEDAYPVSTASKKTSSNRLNIDLKGKTVVVKKEAMKPEYQDNDHLRAFVCEGGFGCSPETSGSMIIGYWLADGERGQIRGFNVEKLYEGSEEVTASKKVSSIIDYAFGPKTAANNYGFEVGQKMWMSAGDTSIPVTIDKIYDNDSFNVSDEDLRSYIVYGWDLYETEQEVLDNEAAAEDEELQQHYSTKNTSGVKL